MKGAFRGEHSLRVFAEHTRKMAGLRSYKMISRLCDAALGVKTKKDHVDFRAALVKLLEDREKTND